MRESVYCDDNYCYIQVDVGDMNEEKINTIIKEKQNEGYQYIDDSFLSRIPSSLGDKAVKFIPERIIKFRKPI